MTNSPRVCPNCHVAIPIDSNFSFDENFNLICDNCNKIAFPVTEESETLFKNYAVEMNKDDLNSILDF